MARRASDLIHRRRWVPLALAAAMAAPASSTEPAVPTRLFFPAPMDFLQPAEAPVGGRWAEVFAGRTWTGLYCDDASPACTLQAVTVRTRARSVTDCRGRSVPATEIAFDPPRPLYVIDAGPRAPGPVPTLMADRSGRELPSGSASAIVSTAPPVTPPRIALPQRPAGDECRDTAARPVDLLVGTRRTSRWTFAICAHRPAFEGEFALHWAGDIDGDGSVDLLMRYPDGTVRLLLSSKPRADLASRLEFPAAGC